MQNITFIRDDARKNVQRWIAERDGEYIATVNVRPDGTITVRDLRSGSPRGTGASVHAAFVTHQHAKETK